MSFRRPCQICHRWFAPDPKVGNRQHVCGDPACRTEAHRRACARWRQKESASLKRKRFATRLIRLAALKGVVWPAAREAGDLKFTLFLAEMVRQLIRRMRETSHGHLVDNKEVIAKVEPRRRTRIESSPVPCKQVGYTQSSLSGGARRDGG